MLPKTRASRRLWAGAGLILASTALVVSVHSFIPPFEPAAPDYRWRGPASAPVLIAVFTDLQCPVCRLVAEPLKKAEEAFPGKVRAVYKHLPLPMHRWARDAAIGTECAGRFGRFWDMHDTLYAQQDVWGRSETPEALRSALRGYARGLKLDEPAFAACLDDPGAAAAVDADVAEGKGLWIYATPTFFINGKRFVGLAQFKTRGMNRIEDLLK
jgi:protein-disulfide isomerase